MQCAVIEFARNVVGLEGAHSTEFDKNSAHPVIALMDEQQNVVDKGGTMRLGAQTAEIKPGTKSMECYDAPEISERHRHRWEFNNAYRKQLEANGMVVAGTSKNDSLVEIVEVADHPWFVAVQYHPEFKSKPTRSHELFSGFVRAATKRVNRDQFSPTV